MDAATSSACLDLTISIPGSNSSSRALNIKPLQVPSKKPEPDDINWINIGFPSNSSEDTLDIDSDSPGRDETRRRALDDPPRKKLRLSKEQSQLLEDSFQNNHTLSPSQKETLADRLNLIPRQVEVWFQNRRARSKLKQTEVECEYLKRWFGSLTEQNRKLQKEVEELRAMRIGPITSKPGPAKSLTMCPGCELVSNNVDRPTSSSTMLDKAQQRNTWAAF